jgi:hypothetical protein
VRWFYHRREAKEGKFSIFVLHSLNSDELLKNVPSMERMYRNDYQESSKEEARQSRRNQEEDGILLYSRFIGKV